MLFYAGLFFIYFYHILFMVKLIRCMSQTLLGNPRGPVEQGNPNICAEVKLYLFFIYSGLRSSLLRD